MFLNGGIHMLRKMFLAFALVAALVAAAPSATVSAESYYMGTYSDGTDAYLLGETVQITERVGAHQHGGHLSLLTFGEDRHLSMQVRHTFSIKFIYRVAFER